MTRIFISYKRESQPFAEILRQRLLDWGYGVWMDIYDIAKGAHWPDEIQKGLEACDVVLGLMTAKAMESRNVKNEWDWAIVYNKRFIPLLIEACTVHMNYVSLNWIDFTRGHDTAFTALESTLKSSPVVTTPADPYRDYLQKLYERINDYLSRAIIRRSERDEAEPIRLVSERSIGMVDALFEKRDEVDPLFAIGFGDEPNPSNESFSDFNQAFEKLDGRILLLGEPGAGKTITLLHFGRDAIVRRTQDAKQPLPILATIPTWDIRSAPPLIEWLAKAYGTPPNTAELIQQGKALLLLDGLDELGGEREDPKTNERIPDPRPRFMDALRALPETNAIIVTCRLKDYEEIGQKIALNGAITLKALSDNQIHDYLRDLPELWEALQSDDQLRDVTRTPILLSYFAFGYKEASLEERQKLRNLSVNGSDEKFFELRDAIFERYVKGRYNHEARKIKARKETIPFTLRQLEDVLGFLAVNLAAMVFSSGYNILADDDFLPAIAVNGIYHERVEDFISFTLKLNLLIEKNVYSFTHLLLRDYFAFRHAMTILSDKKAHLRVNAVAALGEIKDTRAVEMLIFSLHDDDIAVRRETATSLGMIKDKRAVKPLVAKLRDTDHYVRSNVTDALSEIGGLGAVEPLIAALRDENATVRRSVAEALGKLKDLRATEPLIALLADRYDFVRYTTAKALGEIKDSRAVEPLIRALRDESATVRGEVASALGKLRDVYATESLIYAASDIYESVRANAIEALGIIGDLRAIAPLIEALKDDSRYRFGRQICDAAAEALELIGTPEALEAVRQWRASQGGASNAQGDVE